MPVFPICFSGGDEESNGHPSDSIDLPEKIAINFLLLWTENKVAGLGFYPLDSIIADWILPSGPINHRRLHRLVMGTADIGDHLAALPAKCSEPRT